jgi:hypothetical protein
LDKKRVVTKSTILVGGVSYSLASLMKQGPRGWGAYAHMRFRQLATPSDEKPEEFGRSLRHRLIGDILTARFSLKDLKTGDIKKLIAALSVDLDNLHAELRIAHFMCMITEFFQISLAYFFTENSPVFSGFLQLLMIALGAVAEQAEYSQTVQFWPAYGQVYGSRLHIIVPPVAYINAYIYLVSVCSDENGSERYVNFCIIHGVLKSCFMAYQQSVYRGGSERLSTQVNKKLKAQEDTQKEATQKQWYARRLERKKAKEEHRLKAAQLNQEQARKLQAAEHKRRRLALLEKAHLEKEKEKRLEEAETTVRAFAESTNESQQKILTDPVSTEKLLQNIRTAIHSYGPDVINNLSSTSSTKTFIRNALEALHTNSKATEKDLLNKLNKKARLECYRIIIRFMMHECSKTKADCLIYIAEIYLSLTDITKLLTGRKVVGSQFVESVIKQIPSKDAKLVFTSLCKICTAVEKEKAAAQADAEVSQAGGGAVAAAVKAEQRAAAAAAKEAARAAAEAAAGAAAAAKAAEEVASKAAAEAAAKEAAQAAAEGGGAEAAAPPKPGAQFNVKRAYVTLLVIPESSKFDDFYYLDELYDKVQDTQNKFVILGFFFLLTKISFIGGIDHTEASLGECKHNLDASNLQAFLTQPNAGEGSTMTMQHWFNDMQARIQELSAQTSQVFPEYHNAVLRDAKATDYSDADEHKLANIARCVLLHTDDKALAADERARRNILSHATHAQCIEGCSIQTYLELCSNIADEAIPIEGIDAVRTSGCFRKLYQNLADTTPAPRLY